MHWGKGIVIAFIAFIGFILYFVVRMATDDRANHDLVTPDYYKQELAYQKEIDAADKAAHKNIEVRVAQHENGLVIYFPEQFNPKEITGKVSLYRPSNKQLDFDLSISLSNTHLLVPDNRLVDGRWDIAITWSYQGVTFLNKHKITYNP